MIPYHDENETQRTPIVTLVLIAACVIVWILFQGAGAQEPLMASVCNYGLIAGELTGTVPVGAGFQMTATMACLTDPGPQVAHVFTSMFLHGGWMHLIGNMLFLWVFGNNIEDSMSRPRFIVFYLLCGVAAALAQVYSEPDAIVPMVGASGAISGVMGGYLILYPRVRVYTMIPLGFIFTTVALPAWVMLIYWMALQFFNGYFVSAVTAAGADNVAYWAHIGGFVAGVVLIKLFARSDAVARHRSDPWRPQRAGWEYGRRR
ncbi:MAG: rhomboid family intramembrane serine protease [Vicinamibacterales bacterium]|jgi:membrane associated rhomboid family serine protease